MSVGVRRDEPAGEPGGEGTADCGDGDGDVWDTDVSVSPDDEPKGNPGNGPEPAPDDSHNA